MRAERSGEVFGSWALHKRERRLKAGCFSGHSLTRIVPARTHDQVQILSLMICKARRLLLCGLSNRPRRRRMRFARQEGCPSKPSAAMAKAECDRSSDNEQNNAANGRNGSIRARLIRRRFVALKAMLVLMMG